MQESEKGTRVSEHSRTVNCHIFNNEQVSDFVKPGKTGGETTDDTSCVPTAVHVLTTRARVVSVVQSRAKITGGR